MSGETNTKKFFILLERPQKSDVNRHIIDSEDSKTTLSRCRHLDAMEELTKRFTNNFNLPPFKGKKKSWKCNASHQKEFLKNGVLLIVLNDNEIEDATSLSKENKDEILVVAEKGHPKVKK